LPDELVEDEKAKALSVKLWQPDRLRCFKAGQHIKAT